MAGTPHVTQDDVVGLASALVQLTHFHAVVPDVSGPVELQHAQFIDALRTHDPVLADLVSRWCEAASAMRDHVISRVCEPEPAPAFRLGICGHAT